MFSRKFLKVLALFATVVCVNAQDTDSETPPLTEDNLEPPPFPEISEPSAGYGLSRYENTEMLLVSWVPYPVDKWDYVTINISDSEVITGSGRIEMGYFTRESFPDVGIVLACASGDRDYFYNYNLDVPIIGVDPFDEDGIFQVYLDHVYAIHGFQNLAEMWAHFVRYQNAFVPVITRLSEQYQTYLDQWQPRPAEQGDYETSDGIDPRQGRRSGTGRRFVGSRK